MSIKKFIFVVAIFILLYSLSNFLNNMRERNTDKPYVDSIEYDMKITFRKKSTGKDKNESTSIYVLINTNTGLAHFIKHYHQDSSNEKGSTDDYTIENFRLDTSQIDLLKEYSNKESQIVTSSYIEISYNNKITKISEYSATAILQFIDKR